MQGAPAGATLAPPLAGSARVNGHRDYVIKVLLHGLTGDIEGKTYGTAGHGADGVEHRPVDLPTSPATCAARSATARRSSPPSKSRRSASRPNGRQPWTLAELLPTIPAPMTNAAEWKVTASHNPAAASNATSGAPGARWDAGAPQAPGQWFQIELPQPARVAELVIESTLPFSFGGGRGGRGAAPAAGRAAPPAAAATPAGATPPSRQHRCRRLLPPEQPLPAADSRCRSTGRPRSRARRRPRRSARERPDWLHGATVERRHDLGRPRRARRRPDADDYDRLRAGDGEIHPHQPDGHSVNNELWGVARVTVLQVDK